MTREVWVARYPDLAGKVALVAGDGDGLVAVVTALAANGSPVCIVASDRAVVDAAVAAAEINGAIGIAAEPEDPATWTRVLPHTEQRLGPLDIIVAFGPESARRAVTTAALPDMTARRRGVVVEVAADINELGATEGVRRRGVIVDAGTSPADIAAAVALCASDVLAARVATIRLRS